MYTMKNKHFYKSVLLLVAISLHTSCEQEQDQDDMELTTDLVVANLQIGEISESGGMVFYDKGEYSDGWRYIEAAPEDITGEIEWGCFNTPIAEARDLELGMGKSNTEAIVAFHDSLEDYYGNPSVCSAESNGTVAAKTVSRLVINGYDDWYLPSEYEAKLMYENLHLNGLGNFEDADGESGISLYWTSTEHDDNTATAVDFSNGDRGWNCKQCAFGLTRIRAIRYF